MKIVHVVESFGGGVYTYLRDLSHFLSDKPAIDVTIIYSNRRLEITEEQIAHDFPKNIRLICVTMQRELNLIQDLKATFKLRRLFKQLNPDVIHLHSSKAGVLGRGAAFLRGKRNKIFYTPHGYSFLRQDITKTRRKLYYAIEQFTQALLGGTTIACGDTEYELAKKIGTSKLVRNGVNIDKLQASYIPKNSTATSLTIGTIGRIMPQKNPTLFNAIALLFPQHQFVWIGDGIDREILKAPNITITGWFNNNASVLQHLNLLDVYLQTSLWEGLPIAVLEAMTFHKPIIATNIIGNKDIVTNGYNGFLFSTIQELEPLINQLTDPTLLTELGDNAYDTCLNTYNIKDNFKQLLDIYLGSKDVL